jgi:hypothetical protein
MKKSTKLLLITVYIFAFVFAIRHTYNNLRQPDATLNPDPNHTHADFAVWIQGKQMDFAQWQYMSGEPGTHDNGDARFIIPEDAVEQWEAARDEQKYLHKHLHLHDGVGNVIHRHKPGLPILDFLGSIGYRQDGNCIYTDANVPYCDTDALYWRMFINGEEVKLDESIPIDLSYAFEDMDQILLTYDATDEDVATQLDAMTDEACLFSKTCPWRGTPPAENCIADPEIPCAAPLE